MTILSIENDKSKLDFDLNSGCIKSILISDGIKNNQLLAKQVMPCKINELVLADAKEISNDENCRVLEMTYMSPNHKVDTILELHTTGYVICTFEIETLNDNDLPNLRVGVDLDNDTVFKNAYNIKHVDKEDMRRYNRATSVLFSTDDRPITNSVDFILEKVNDGEKIVDEKADSTFIGWELESKNLSKKGSIYSNRWCLHFSKIDSNPNKVRGQRIYHWYGFYPNLPTMDIIEEMAEYGCSILILHMPSFKWIDGSIPIDEFKFKAIIDKAHRLGIKMMFYIQPLLISRTSPAHKGLEHTLNDNGKLCWHSLKDTQIVFYMPNSDYDCDELCLRCPEAYSYIKESVMECYTKYGFDGLYIDFAWPSIAVCTDGNHGHRPGIFNFYDYLRMMREFRESIGPDAIMIGHGGSLLVSSDYAEGFDACLTGEGQKDLLPDVIGMQTGTAPTLWTMHRRKERQFRSRESMASIIREGITPHIGLGILGKSIMATMDPAHTPHYLALWQMFRAFPMEKAIYYNYLTEKVLSLDNDEVTYSMYMTPQKQILLIVCNGGGPESESAVSVEVNIRLDTDKLGLQGNMKCWMMRGFNYENFRITSEKNINGGLVRIPEIGIDEFVGVILTEGQPPEEMQSLIKHLEGRFERLTKINKNKMRRLVETDHLLAEFNELDVKTMTEEEFMKDRTME